ECLLQERSAPRFPFAVQDMTERGDLVARTEVGVAQVAPDETEPIRNAVSLRGTASSGEHTGPIDRSHLHVWRLLRHGHTPDARTRRQVEHRDWLGGRGNVEMFAQRTGRSVTHREEVLNELKEERCALFLLVDGSSRLASADDVGEL